MNQYLIVGIIGSDWENSSFVAHPFQVGEQVLKLAKNAVAFRIQRNKHLLVTALDWVEKIAANPHIQAADVARMAGCSTGRVRQILRLRKLHPEIQGAILALPGKQAVKRFPERMMRTWVSMPTEEQLSQFEARRAK